MKSLCAMEGSGPDGTQVVEGQVQLFGEGWKSGEQVSEIAAGAVGDFELLVAGAVVSDIVAHGDGLDLKQKGSMNIRCILEVLRRNKESLCKIQTYKLPDIPVLYK